MSCCPTWCKIDSPHVIHRDVMPVNPGTPRVEVSRIGSLLPPEVAVTTTCPGGQVTKERYSPDAARALGEETYAARAVDLGCWLIIAADVADGVEEAAGLALLTDLLTPAGGAR